MSLLKEKALLELEEAEFYAGQTLNRFPPLMKYALYIILLGTIPAYLITKQVSRAYWDKHYKNAMVSAVPSFLEAQSPKLSPTTLISHQGSYTAVLEISNENIDLSLPETSFKIDFTNNLEQTVYTYEGKLFLLPNQKKYIVVPRFQTNEAIKSADFSFLQQLKWQKRLSIPKVNLAVIPATFENQTEPAAFVIESGLSNQSPYNIKQARLTFVVKDVDGKIITASQRDEFTLKPKELRSFKQSWPNLFIPNASKIEVYAETNPLDRNNLGVQAQDSTNASDLSRPN